MLVQNTVLLVQNTGFFREQKKVKEMSKNEKQKNILNFRKLKYLSLKFL